MVYLFDRNSGDSRTEIKEKTVLKLNFNGQFVDLKKPEDPFQEVLGSAVHTISMRDLDAALQNAALDPNVKGISIQLDDPRMGFAELDEVKGALLQFKKSGKFIYTFSEYLSEKAVLLAALALTFTPRDLWNLTDSLLKLPLSVVPSKN